tara:strand:+ start:112 stop:267 length:156 start_codon:yes stop_codon:yes gene_type:complete
MQLVVRYIHTRTNIVKEKIYFVDNNIKKFVDKIYKDAIVNEYRVISLGVQK